MFSTIVVGTDGSETAAVAVQQAAELAGVHGSKLHLVSVVRTRAGGVAVPIAGAAASDVGVSDAISEKVARELVDGVAAELGDIVAATHVGPGDPAEVIVSVAREVGADLIVVGNKGMHRKVFGSVPNSVAHHAPCDVLIVATA